ncbi:Aldo/keto reductase [Stereum hirsutum FP-91666 SS1]|uniref:Aldo/keto reductase n=1 Tax=Stereum hirsutum (strain FP-91666) TaxID=721885 RepID=UPI00044498E1|nr:Aldo/keto reductase [Stereum hirsutum FP-91666 SS1]EIM85931.1 Aldo/keto reductase [Stereum hirsutum FP-91666 SS1]
MSAFYPGIAPPASKLAKYRTLSPLCGLRVSPIQLGAMSIGDKWAAKGMGSMDKESSFKLLDAYFGLGGNFIDTANAYQDESSEEFLGEWMESRGNRDQIVLATKYTSNFKRHIESPHKITFVGNNVKSMNISVEASLKKLRTSYIDILYLHWWDWASGVEEVMNGLHNLVAAGKVCYLGVSDTPAWIVSQANQYARDHGKTPFVIYQGQWNIMKRSFEREIIPMARTLGLALAPWDVLGAGKIRTDAEEARRRESGEKGRMIFGPEWERTADEKKVCAVLEEVGKEVGVGDNVQAVAIAYLMQKTPYVFPILGGRKIEHLEANIKALDIALTGDQIKRLEGVLPFDIGFPGTMVGVGTSVSGLLQGQASCHLDVWPLPAVIKPTAQ